MRSRGEAWRLRVWIWAPALVFFLANAAGFIVYRLGYSGRVAALESTLTRQEKDLRDLESMKKDLQTQLTRVSINEKQVRQLYADRLATRSQRVTLFTSEVRNLARKAGLEPRAFSYPEEDIDDYGLIKRSSIFQVEGTYAELRQFLHLLEASRSFLTVEEINMAGSSGGGPELRIEIAISTLFARDPESAAPAAPAGTAAAETGGTGAGGAS